MMHTSGLQSKCGCWWLHQQEANQQTPASCRSWHCSHRLLHITQQSHASAQSLLDRHLHSMLHHVATTGFIMALEDTSNNPARVHVHH